MTTMTYDPNTRQHRSEMGKLFAEFATGMAMKAAIVGLILYAGVHGYHWLVDVFAPVSKAMGG